MVETSIPLKMQFTPSSNVQFWIPEPNQHHEEVVVDTQQSIAAKNFTNWQRFGNHQVGDRSMADGGEGRFRVFF